VKHPIWISCIAATTGLVAFTATCRFIRRVFSKGATPSCRLFRAGLVRQILGQHWEAGELAASPCRPQMRSNVTASRGGLGAGVRPWRLHGIHSTAAPSRRSFTVRQFSALSADSQWHPVECPESAPR
jgi:hypothetical protein